MGVVCAAVFARQTSSELYQVLHHYQLLHVVLVVVVYNQVDLFIFVKHLKYHNMVEIHVSIYFSMLKYTIPKDIDLPEDSILDASKEVSSTYQNNICAVIGGQDVLLHVISLSHSSADLERVRTETC